ncbi:helix-turn-helix domain-containing protein [Paracoccus sp. S-4012]|uniref:helix-turn-helix domain-containing protein n=1 Tax=Paracoccus sp. S-4012 TaxID=2665648 RepID=UPI0012B152AD|nr:helix-turn-helix transcriptional regulator [Paracoccus sp. S-4012]MRX50146.1 helix-turn-helix domain-containing protein [Paracoccus sp. S-4012]
MDSKAAISIGARLRGHRQTTGLAPEEMAARLGISRAALYRAERGEIVKVETLGRIAGELGVSIDDLFGVGVEYYAEAADLFERMGELERHARRITGVFGPVSYLVTSGDYDRLLGEALAESGAGAKGVAVREALARRKAGFAAGRAELRSLICLPDLDRLLARGVHGRGDLAAEAQADRRRAARTEVERLARLFTAPPPRVEIRLIETAAPTASFEIVEHAAGEAHLVTSPFSLGERVNIALGIGSVSRAPEAVETHRRVVERLWAEGAAGAEAAAIVAALLARHPAA